LGEPLFYHTQNQLEFSAALRQPTSKCYKTTLRSCLRFPTRHARRRWRRSVEDQPVARRPW